MGTLWGGVWEIQAEHPAPPGTGAIRRAAHLDQRLTLILVSVSSWLNHLVTPKMFPVLLKGALP